MKVTKLAGKKIRLPAKDATYEQLSNFFDRQDGSALLAAGITQLDSNTTDLDQMRLQYWKEPNTKQINIRIPATAKRLIERLAKRKTVEVSTLVRMWVMDGMRRESLDR